MTVPNNTLPVSSLISVSTQLVSGGVQAPNTSTLLILSNNTVIDTVQRIRSYPTLASVAAQFGTSAPEYLEADLWFSQNSQPTTLYIGRWVDSAAAGQLLGGSLTAAQQALSVWTPITNGGFHVTIDGGGPDSVTGLNFSAATTMQAVAAIISAGLTGATCTWDSITSRFVITSNTTGASSSVSFLTAPGSGTDISGDMVGTNTPGNGAYLAPGLAVETAVAAVTLFDTQFGQQWYAVTVIGAVDSDHEAIAPYIEGSNNKHLYVITSQEAGILSSASTSDIAYILNALGYKKTVLQYSSSSAYACSSLISRILTTDWTGNKTAITVMWKQEPGVLPEYLTPSQMATISVKGANVFSALNNNTMIIQPGQVIGSSPSNPLFVDTVVGADVLTLAVQQALFNLLYTTPTKIPQDDSGTQQLVAAVTAVLEQFVTNGYLAPGTWTGPYFGALQPQNGNPPTLTKGYYVYAPPVATQSESTRASRLSVPIQIAAKLAGAVQTVNCSITILP